MILLHIIAVTEISRGGLPKGLTNSDAIGNALSIVFGIVGALSLLIIVVSGLRYITSAGDPEKTARARNGVVYALIGLIIAISAQAIVVFVVKRLGDV